MSELEVRIVRLEPMVVAAALGFGEQPELEAWNLIWSWVKALGLSEKIKEHRFFGFNNPSPSPGSPNYGYEQWMTVGPEVKPEGDIKIKEFPGGLYAVMRCNGIPNPDIWGQLVLWREHSQVKLVHHQWLEECLNPLDPPDKLVFDLYLPIAR